MPAADPERPHVAPATTPDEVLDMKGAAETLLLHVVTFRRHVAAGRVPGRRVGGVWRFTRAGLLQWLKGSALASGPESAQAPRVDISRAMRSPAAAALFGVPIAGIRRQGVSPLASSRKGARRAG